MQYDVIVIGAGLSGLTAAALLAKRGLKVAVIDKSYNPGGSCGIFKRGDTIFDQGSAILFGFGEKGFNPHRFVFNCLEEPIDMLQHDQLYCVNYRGKKIKFWPSVKHFVEELGKIFPSEKSNIRRFYSDMDKMYHHVMVENPVYTTPDEKDRLKSLPALLKHPLSYARFLGYMNKSARSLLEKYFQDPQIFNFFDKLTSTCCYTTTAETPAILAAIMFIENHVGGSFYPAGSTVFLPGKLEKVIEENSGTMLMEKEVVQILFADGKPAGVKLESGEELHSHEIIYSGTVWNLYGRLIAEGHLPPGRKEWAEKQVPTYPSVVLYALVERDAIPVRTMPIELLIGNPDRIDESEVTVCIFSIDDRTLCDEGSHVLVARGPTFEEWDRQDQEKYAAKKEKEKERLLAILEKRFPGLTKKVKYTEMATPATIERYTMKNGGAVAGPKQMLGQHLLNRLHTRTGWNSLFCCGESTVMGTGTPAVTVSGLSAANAVLKKRGLAPFAYRRGMKNYVRLVDKPSKPEDLYSEFRAEKREIMLKARQCEYCEKPGCREAVNLDVRGIMRRATVGNFVGAGKIAHRFWAGGGQEKDLFEAMQSCVHSKMGGVPVDIATVVGYFRQGEQEHGANRQI